MGSSEGMTKGSDARYLGDKEKLKIAQGVVGAVADKGPMLKILPYTMQSVKQGFQDLAYQSMKDAHESLKTMLSLEVRTGAAQLEGGVRGLLSYEKKSCCGARPWANFCFISDAVATHLEIMEFISFKMQWRKIRSGSFIPLVG